LDSAAEENPGDAELAARVDRLARGLAFEGRPVDGALPGHGEIAARDPLPKADRLEDELRAGHELGAERGKRRAEPAGRASTRKLRQRLRVVEGAEPLLEPQDVVRKR